MSFRQKIHSDYQNAQVQTQFWKDSGLEVVFTNGCFDLIHAGHIDYLEKASKLGDKLVVALNSDKSVAELKGDHRPINDLRTRTELIASLEYVDLVIVFDEKTPLILIKEITPDVLVKGGDYKKSEIVGNKFVVSMGGIVETIPFLPGYSSTSVITKIRSQK